MTVHQGQPIVSTGTPLDNARAALVLVHGRGDSAEGILGLVPYLSQPGFAFLAPQAAGNTWYPNRFLAPVASNEPWLSSALGQVEQALRQVEAGGIAPEQTILLGFSQGACLVLEYAARHPRRYGGVAGLSGALIGPPDSPYDYAGSLDGTPVFLGCSDVDFHIPLNFVKQATQAFTRLGAQVTERIYPGMAHTVNDDELAVVRGMMENLITR